MIQGIHHVAVRVTDLERSIAFYVDRLGFTVRTRTALASGARIAFLAHPNGGSELELIAGQHDHHAGDGLVHHVAFVAADVAAVDAVFARLQEAGVTMLEAAPETLASGRRLFSFRGPDGERLQVTSA
jgi:catechol 2,3-dioxygenase-like lactoylglutathione lyase family enzyme